MIPERLRETLEANGYRNVRELPDGTIIGTSRMMFTTGLFADIDAGGYGVRWCYATEREAAEACNAWDGEGDPPGQWIVRKGAPDGDKHGPGSTRETA